MESNKFKPITKCCLDIGDISSCDPKYDSDYHNKKSTYFTTAKLMNDS